VEADGTGDYSAGRIRAALSAAGWHITSFTQMSTGVFADPSKFYPDFDNTTAIPAVDVYYTADKGALKLSGFGSVVTGHTDSSLAAQARYFMYVWPREPLVVRPLTIAGSVIGAVAGWLLAAAGAYRARGSGRRRRWVATALSAAGFAAATVPVYEHYRHAYEVMVHAHGPVDSFLVSGPPHDAGLSLACTVLGLIAFVGAFASARPGGMAEASPGGPGEAGGQPA
jgi:hypothetical protein